MTESYDFDSVDWISAGAVGEPGRRTFYLQARKDQATVALTVEKSQVQALSTLAQRLLARVGVTVTPDDLDEHAQRLVEPVDSAWRAASLSLGMDETGERFVLEAEELTEAEGSEAATARFWVSRPQMVALAAHAAFAVEAGARERCRFCGRPKDPVSGHVCPATNGHGPLTV